MKYQVVFKSKSVSPMISEFDNFSDAKKKLDATIKDCETSAWFNNDRLYLHKKSQVYYEIQDGYRVVFWIYIKKIS